MTAADEDSTRTAALTTINNMNIDIGESLDVEAIDTKRKYINETVMKWSNVKTIKRARDVLDVYLEDAVKHNLGNKPHYEEYGVGESEDDDALYIAPTSMPTRPFSDPVYGSGILEDTADNDDGILLPENILASISN